MIKKYRIIQAVTIAIIVTFGWYLILAQKRIFVELNLEPIPFLYWFPIFWLVLILWFAPGPFSGCKQKVCCCDKKRDK